MSTELLRALAFGPYWFSSGRPGANTRKRTSIRFQRIIHCIRELESFYVIIMSNKISRPAFPHRDRLSAVMCVSIFSSVADCDCQFYRHFGVAIRRNKIWHKANFLWMTKLKFLAAVNAFGIHHIGGPPLIKEETVMLLLPLRECHLCNGSSSSERSPPPPAADHLWKSF